MSSIQAFKAAGLPVVDMSKMKAALGAAAQAAKAAADGVILLRLMKDGRWVYGSDDVEDEQGALWAVNPYSLSMGWAAWGDERGPNKGKLMGEMMALIYDTPIGQGSLPDVGETWNAQVQFDLVCVKGEDEGTQVRYKTTSVGGRRAFAGLIQEVSEHADSDGHVVPVIELLARSYKHKDWGQVYTPVFEVHEWRAPEDSSPAAGAAAEPGPDEVDDQPTEPAPTRRRGAAASAPAEQPEKATAAPRRGAAATANATPTPQRGAAAKEQETPAPRRGASNAPPADRVVDRGAVVRRRR